MNTDSIMNKYLVTEESVTQYWNKIPLRARIMIHPITKLLTVSGKDWEDVKNQVNKVATLKIGASEMETLFKELEKVKFVTVKESPNLIAVAITELGKRMEAKLRDEIQKKMKEPATPEKYSKQDIEALTKYYSSGKSGKFTGD
jgi:hypothetical protein